MKNYLTTSEAAEICQVSRGTILRWIHEGLIRASSTMGGHSRVSIEDLKAALVKMGMPVPERLIHPDLPREKGLRILIVEDDCDLRQILTVVLHKNFPNAEIREASDGFTAGYVIEEFNPSIIFLDVRLPGISGEDICRKIRANDKFRSSAVLGMTAFGKDAVERMIAAGADSCFEKDFNEKQLVDFIRRFEANLKNLGGRAA